MIFKVAQVSMLFMTAFWFCSCNATKYIAESEKLVTSSKIKILDKGVSAKNLSLEDDLEAFIIQKPNTNWLGIPREYIYLTTEENDLVNKVIKNFREKFGQKPVLLDSSLVQKSANDIQKNLQVSNGFYDAVVNPEVKIANKKAKINYLVSLNTRYTISDINYYSDDTACLNLILEKRQSALVKPGDYVNTSSLELEKSRITNHLQENGYVEFTTNYIKIKGDSNVINKTVELFFEILRPGPGENHHIYRNGNISVYTDYYNKQDTFSLSEEDVGGVRFLRENLSWVIMPKYLDDHIFLKEGYLSKRSDRSKSFKKLSALSTYKFAAINAFPNEYDSTLIDYNILLTPHDFKWLGDFGADVYYSTGAQFKNLFGLSLNGRLTNRNAFKGSEQYSLTGDVSTELSFDNNFINDPNKFVVARTINAGLQNSIDFPRIIKYTQFSTIFNRMGILSDNLYNGFQQEATTNVSLGFRLSNFLNLYNLNSARATLGYKYNDGLRHNVSLDQFGLTINDVTQGALFDSILCSQSEIYCLSLTDNLFTGFLFNSLFYVYNRPNLFGKTSFSGVYNLETSGLEVYGLNKLSNLVTGNDNPWTFFNNRFEFSKFIKLEVDNRFTTNIGSNRSFAWRINAGAIVPYGDSEVTPFIRQFSAGGPNSLRGWLPRQLVGGIVDTTTQNFPIYQGDIKLEANAEFRFDMFWLVEGAFFVDAGNVWQITEASEPGAKFTKDFHKQIAVAGGWGLRLDFGYFLIRLDFGYKLRNPFPSEPTGKYWNNWGGIRSQRLGNPQIGINYPF